jgi:hypothetical protein
MSEPEKYLTNIVPSKSLLNPDWAIWSVLRIAELEAENTALRELCDKADEIMERMAEEAREDDTIRTLAQALLTALEKKQYLSVPPEAWPDIAPAANALYKALGDNE